MAHGGKRKGAGRKKGSVDNSTLAVRTAIADFIGENSEKIDGWVEEIYADKGAQGALDAFMGFLEYSVPKLSRTEQQFLDKDGEKTNPVVVVLPAKDDPRD